MDAASYLDQDSPVSAAAFLDSDAGANAPAQSNEIEQLPNYKPDASDAFNSHLVNSVTFGLAKPANALVNAGLGEVANQLPGGNQNLGFGDIYDTAVARGNEMQSKEEEAHPIASGLGTGLGIAASLGLAAPEVGMANAGKVVPFATKAANLGKAALTNSAVAGGLNATEQGMNTIGSADDKLDAALKGGEEGAAAGALITPVIAGGGKIASTLYNAGSGLFQKAYSAATTPDAQKAIENIAAKFQKDNITGDEAVRLLQDNPNATVADVGGTNVQGATRALFNSPGEAQSTIFNTIINRDAGARDRLQATVKTGFNLKNDDEFNATGDEIAARMKAQAKPLYNQFYQGNPVMASPEIDRILATPAGSSALKQAVTDMQNGRSQVAMSDPELTEQAKLAGSYVPGSGGVAAGLKGETLDYVKRALDEQVEKAGAYTSSGGKINTLKNDLLSEMDRLDTTGAYKQARAGWSSDRTSKNALENGRDFLGDDSQVTANYVKGLGDNDQQLFKMGVARKISDMLADNPKGTMTKLITPGTLLNQKVQSAFPNKNDFFNFIGNVQRENNLTHVKEATIGNSTTIKQNAEKQDLEGGEGTPFGLNLGNIADIADLKLAGPAIQIGKSVLNRVQMGNPGVQTEMAKALMGRNAQPISDAMMKGYSKIPVNNMSPISAAFLASLQAQQNANQ